MGFAEILEKISDSLGCDLEKIYACSPRNIPFDIKLSYAIKLWCRELEISNNIASYIIQGCQLDSVKGLTEFIWQEAIQEKKTWKIPTVIGELPTVITTKNQFYQQINFFLIRMNIRSGNMKLIAMLAFGVTAIGFWLYKTNLEKQLHQTDKHIFKQKSKQNEYIPNYSLPVVHTVNKQFLVLVISASQANFFQFLKAKRSIDINDAEKLYKITKYLWLGSETDFNQNLVNLKNYLVTTDESEFDINLVYFELNQTEEAG